MMTAESIGQKLTCFHCGSTCEETLWADEKSFCCFGCRTVYEILRANQLCNYYELYKKPGRQLKDQVDQTYQFLDEQDARKKLLLFDSPSFATVKFHIPAIHCISCIWLLENLRKIDERILKTEVNFGQKTVTIDFDPERGHLSSVATLLGTLGYAPRINLDAERPIKPKSNRSLILKVAVAGFCFGNVMLFSFPEYLGIDQQEKRLTGVFSWLNLALSLPVLFYSGWDYLRSAAKSFRQKQINIDVPIAAGLLTVMLRSGHEIITATGPGYLDSFTGLVFFLLIGRWVQSRTYESLAFDRDFTSYFPLAVNRLTKNEWKPVVIYKLERNDIIRLRNMEIVPADCILLEDRAHVDYSFVTGESTPVKVDKGGLVYAGGKLIGPRADFLVDKKTSQSHLTTLWNHDAFKRSDARGFQKIIDRTARQFTWAVLGIALITAIYWQHSDPKQTWLVLTSVLMVACPCALALAAPFTFGSTLRAFGRNQLYLKNSDVIERMAKIDAVVFDKTGTVTHGGNPVVTSHGSFSDDELARIKNLTAFSTHLLSKQIHNAISGEAQGNITAFKEIPGKGMEGMIDGHLYRVGAPDFTRVVIIDGAGAAVVTVAIDGIARGYFTVATTVRKDLPRMLTRLGRKCVALLSGDRDADRSTMETIFPQGARLLFTQSPEEKLLFIHDLRMQGKKVLMVGDGLNDAGALKQSDVGIAITDDTGVFTPACDGILQGDQIRDLDKFLDMARSSLTIVKGGFGISFFYNAVALTFAVTGHLTPLVAAVLMPASSISVVSFSTLAVNFVAKRKLKT